MKALLIIAISVGYFAPVSYAQNVDSVSKIIIDFGHGHNSWEPGVYSIAEIFEYKRVNEQYFENSKSIFIKYILEKNGYKYARDTSQLPLKRHYIHTKIIGNLLLQLNTPKNNFTKSFILPLLKIPSKSKIIRIAKQNNYRDMFFGKYSGKEDRDTIVKRLQSFYMIDSFLNEVKPDTTGGIVVVDAYHGCRVYIIRGSDTTRYDLSFLNNINVFLGQPIAKIENGDFTHIKHIVNLEVNEILMSFLPLRSLLVSDLNYNSITEQYIKWFFRNNLYR